MSIESAKAFMERMKTDGGFAEHVRVASDKEARMEFVRGAGYEFTLEEIAAVREQMSDEDLDAVAGGVVIWGIDTDGGDNQPPAYQHQCYGSVIRTF